MGKSQYKTVEIIWKKIQCFTGQQMTKPHMSSGGLRHKFETCVSNLKKRVTKVTFSIISPQKYPTC